MRKKLKKIAMFMNRSNDKGFRRAYGMKMLV